VEAVDIEDTVRQPGALVNSLDGAQRALAGAMGVSGDGGGTSGTGNERKKG